MSSFENSFQKYKQNFRNIEKLAKKCVNLKGSIIYIYVCECVDCIMTEFTVRL